MKRKQRHQRWIAVLRYNSGPYSYYGESRVTFVRTFKTHEASEEYYNEFFSQCLPKRRCAVAPCMIGHIKYDDL